MQNRKRTHLLLACASALLAFLPLAGCGDDGPAEEFGEDVDEAVEDVDEELEELGDEIEDATDE